MELAEVLRRRRMVRRFDDGRPVPADALDRILGAGLRAPSAGFSQGWDFVVLREQQDVAAYWAVTSEDGADDAAEGTRPDAWLEGVRRAPVLVLCCSDRDAYLDRYAEPDKSWEDRDEARWPVPYWDIDTGMAALLMLLGAVDEGLGALFFGVPPEYHDGVQDRFAIPRNRTLVGVVAIGYEAAGAPVAGSARHRQRRPTAQVLHFGKFRAPDSTV